MSCTGEVHILRESQHAVYRNDIARLHGLLDVKNAANQILRDAMTAQRADHAASEARIRREMAPGFSWPYPDHTRLLSAKIDSQEATMTKMAAKTAKTSAENKRLKAENGELRVENAGLRTENAWLKAKLAAKEDDKLEKAVAKLADVAYVRDSLRKECAQANGGYAAGMVSRLAGIVDEIGALKRLHARPEDDKLDRIAGELALITTELNALRFLCKNPGDSGEAILIAELEKVTAERDALRNLYAHHNTSGTNLYSKRRSQVNEDIRNMEKEIAEELGTTLDTERAKAAAGSGACRAEGGRGCHTGSSHHLKAEEKIWYTLTRCNCCQATGSLIYRYASGVLVNDFFEDRMWIKTTAHVAGFIRIPRISTASLDDLDLKMNHTDHIAAIIPRLQVPQTALRPMSGQCRPVDSRYWQRLPDQRQRCTRFSAYLGRIYYMVTAGRTAYCGPPTACR